MLFDFNTLFAIDNKGNVLQEFNEMEDAAKYENTVPFKIVLYNKITKTGMLVPEEELNSCK